MIVELPENSPTTKAGAALIGKIARAHFGREGPLWVIYRDGAGELQGVIIPR